MRYWETEDKIPLSWRDLAAGYWWRYPNPQSSHVFSVDTLETRLEGDKLYARRLIMKTNPLPSWGKHFFSARRVAVIEEVEVDRVEGRLTWYTRNIGLNTFMATVERATLLSTGTETLVRKQCWIDSSIVGFRSAIKKFGVERYKKNCGPATQGFRQVVQQKLSQDRDGQTPAPARPGPVPASVVDVANSGPSLGLYKSVQRWQCDLTE